MKEHGRSKTLERFYAASDLPIPILYKELDASYPGSRFILTLRNEQKWLESVRKMWDPAYNSTRRLWDVYPISHTLHNALYGRVDFDPETMINRYRQHNLEVRKYFRDRPGDLLVMDMEAGAGWSELCAFIGIDQPIVPYPTEYKTSRLRTDNHLGSY
jgi:hypothetical protein